MAKAAAEKKPQKSIFELEETNRKKLKVVSALIDKDMKDIVNEALSDWFAKYEKKNKPIPIK